MSEESPSNADVAEHSDAAKKLEHIRGVLYRIFLATVALIIIDTIIGAVSVNSSDSIGLLSVAGGIGIVVTGTVVLSGVYVIDAIEAAMSTNKVSPSQSSGSA